MKLCTSLVTAFAILVIGRSTAQAVVIFEDNFDSYTTQAEFEAVWPVYNCCGATSPATSAVFSQEQAKSPANSIQVPANSTTNNLNRNMHSFADVGTGGPGNPDGKGFLLFNAGEKAVFSFDFYDSNAAAAPYRQYSELRDATEWGAGTNQLIGMGLNNNQSTSNSGGNYYMARILGYTPFTTTDPEGGPAESVAAAGSYFKLNDFGTSVLRSTGWHNLKVELTKNATNGNAVDFAFSVDDQLSERVTGIGLTLRTWDMIVLGGGLSNGNNAAWFDNFHFEFNTAPTPQAGDFNNDGKVDAGDYVTWRKGTEPGNENNPLANDNGLGTPVGSAHYDLWRANFGNPPGAGSGGGLIGGAVPEPTTVGLIFIGLAAFGLKRRGR
jgi:PEP-CTERM motif-containing protein